MARRQGCHRIDLHTVMPAGYLDWHEWAEEMSKTHHQERCPGCGMLAIWKPGPTPVAGALTEEDRRA